MGRIHGRVAGREAALEELTVRIEDSVRGYQPLVREDGTFEMNLPPGNYGIVARAGNEVAVAQIDDLRENEDRTVVLVLVEGVAIAGRVEGCSGPCREASIRVQVPGVRLGAGTSESDGKGEFVVEGLVPGRSYDLVFEAKGKRRLVMRSVSAPAQGIVATLEAAATLSGGFGLEPGQKCPMEIVELSAGDEMRSSQISHFDRSCRFRLEDLPEAEDVHLRASGKGWHFELDVPLPAHGDPPFLCLRPPCREPEPEPEASLEIVYSGASPRQMYVHVGFPENTSRIATSCDPSAGPCVLADLRPSPGVQVHVGAIGCERRSFTLDLRPGANSVIFTCEGMRRIQGVLKGSAERIATTRAMVRCSSEQPPRPAHGFVFVLQCPEHLSTVEYQLVPEGPWRVAPIARGNANGWGFVEIAVE